MTASQTTIEAELAELVDDSFSTFCEEIGAMFEWEMESERKEVCVETVKGLQKRFKKFVAVYDVQTKGVLDGTFQIIFDHAGLFTLASMIVMLPDKLISKHRKSGTIKEANEIDDAVKEAGNLFIGTLDKVFREGMAGHGHFVHTNTFVGEPWKESDERTGEDFADEFLFVVCEMKIEPYPPFQCGVTFPKNVYDHTADAEPSAAVEPEAQVEAEQQDQTAKTEDVHFPSEGTEEVTPDAESSATVEPEAQVEAEQQDQTAKTEDDHFPSEETEEVTPDAESSAAVEPEAQVEAEQQDQTVKTENDRVVSEETEKVASDAEPSAVEAKAQAEAEQQSQAVKAEIDRPSPEEKAKIKSGSEKSIAEAISSPMENASVRQEEQPEQTIRLDIKREPTANVIEDVSRLCAKDIMQGNVLWCSSEEGMGEVLAKMCQSGMNYALIGPQGTPEGIVSMSDLRAGMSPYLRPEFAKWRRPIDDASLRIKVKWLMNKEIHTVKSQDGLSEVATSMCHLGLHLMPVVDREGRIEGMVNVFDVLRTLSRSETKVAM